MNILYIRIVCGCVIYPHFDSARYISQFALSTRHEELIVLYIYFFFKEIGIILSSNTLTDMPSNGTPAFDKNICWLNSFSFRTRGLPCYSELKHCSSILKL